MYRFYVRAYAAIRLFVECKGGRVRVEVWKSGEDPSLFFLPRDDVVSVVYILRGEI
jgi:hypothetical protein